MEKREKTKRLHHGGHREIRGDRKKAEIGIEIGDLERRKKTRKHLITRHGLDAMYGARSENQSFGLPRM